MKPRVALALVVSFAGGVLLTVGAGGALGVFDQGPTEHDVADARARGQETASVEVDARMAGAEQAEAEAGFQRGREASEWLMLDRMPDPDSWFTGVMAGRRDAAQAAQDSDASDAWRQGYDDGVTDGIDHGVGFQRPPGE